MVVNHSTAAVCLLSAWELEGTWGLAPALRSHVGLFLRLDTLRLNVGVLVLQLLNQQESEQRLSSFWGLQGQVSWDSTAFSTLEV